MDMEGLKNSTKLRTARSWSWEERTPGTARTIALSVVFVSLLAIPALLTSPAILGYVLELATLSREGVTPTDFVADEIVTLQNNPSNIDPVLALFALLGELGRLLADLSEGLISLLGLEERPAF